eukprot:8332217-Alexandrium_andersonii.AAC.1
MVKPRQRDHKDSLNRAEGVGMAVVHPVEPLELVERDRTDRPKDLEQLLRRHPPAAVEKHAE